MTEEYKEFSFNDLLPTGEKLMVWLTYSTILGLIIFPFLALTIEQKFAIHFWVLTALDIGLLFALLYLRGQMMQIDNEKQQFIQPDQKKAGKQKKSLENEKDKVAQKAKKELQKQNQKNFQKQTGKQKSFQQRK